MKITSQNIDKINIIPSSDQGVIVDFSSFDADDAIIFSRLLAQRLRDQGLNGMVDAIPGMNNLLICYDSIITSHETIAKEALSHANGLDASDQSASRLWRLPVCYGGEFGPDLEEVAQENSLSPEDVITRHTANELTVAIMGFLPGLAYMKGVDKGLYRPRRSSPRQHVPALSLGIAMDQTVIYPLASPGGWNLIGRVPFHPFDAHRADPVLFRAGDRVQFFAVDQAEYHEWQAGLAQGRINLTPENTPENTNGDATGGAV